MMHVAVPPKRYPIACTCRPSARHLPVGAVVLGSVNTSDIPPRAEHLGPTAAASPAQSRPRLQWLFYAALVCFFIGLVCVGIAFAYPLITGGNGVLWAYLAGMVLVPLGLLLGLGYAVVSSRRPE